MAVDLVTEDARAIVLVEGLSDRAALEALARRRGRDLAAERISIVAIGGAQRIGRVIGQFGPGGLDLGLAGLVDAGEERYFQRALERAGLIREATRTGLERLGFYVCERDLEDELLRALGPDAVERVLSEQGELRSFRTYQKQLAHRDEPRERQLWGFMHNRKVEYGSLLVDALDLDRVPRPLDGVLAAAGR